MIGLELHGAKEAIARIQALKLTADVEARKALGELGQAGRMIMVREILRQPQRRDPFWGTMGTGSPFGLGVRSGKTAQRIVGTGQVYEVNGELRTFIGSPDRHMRQLEDGGTVTGTPWLKIPTAAAQKPAGDPRYAANEKVEGSFIWPTSKMVNFKGEYGRPKNLWIVRRKGDRLEKLYMLKRSVTHKAHRAFATLRDMMNGPTERAGNTIAAAVVKTF